MKVGKCRSCGEEIIWATTTKGKKMPLDAEPHEKGTFEIRGEGDDATAHFLGKNGEYASGYQGPRYNCHFETCATADQHRGSK